MAALSPGFFKPSGISAGAVQAPSKKGAPSLFNSARGKKRPAPTHSGDEEEEEEDSEGGGVVNQGDLWGSEDSDADMVDDYGADSSSEDEDEDDGAEVSFISLGLQKAVLAFQSLSRSLRLSLGDRDKPEWRKGILVSVTFVAPHLLSAHVQV